jgi:hypothetical protein
MQTLICQTQKIVILGLPNMPSEPTKNTLIVKTPETVSRAAIIVMRLVCFLQYA